jgi:hypothetical protein
MTHDLGHSSRHDGFRRQEPLAIDRGDGVPSVNLVVLSFVDPLKLLNKTNDAQTINGAPIGMNQQVVSYFTSHNVRVMLSIGGITFVSNWDTALRPIQRSWD